MAQDRSGVMGGKNRIQRYSKTITGVKIEKYTLQDVRAFFKGQIFFLNYKTFKTLSSFLLKIILMQLS